MKTRSEELKKECHKALGLKWYSVDGQAYITQLRGGVENEISFDAYLELVTDWQCEKLGIQGVYKDALLEMLPHTKKKL